MAFIISKRNFLIHRPGAEDYRIPKDYIGEIPEDVYNSHMVQKCIEAGTILVPASKADKDIQAAEDQAEKTAEDQVGEKAETKKKNTAKK